MRKKVVLVNTHLDGIMNASDIFIERLRRLFLLLEEYDLVVWWRPHPLSKTTIRSMNPQLLDSYEQLIEEFMGMPLGIYDESGDLNRAIAVSDFYVGDPSSLVNLYEATGKPAMVLSPFRKNQFPYNCLQFQAGVQKDDWIYFSAIYFNGFFKLSMSTGQMEYLGRFQKEELMPNLHCGAYIWENTCWFMPNCGEYITKINLDTLEQQHWDCSGLLDYHDDSKFIDYAAGNHEIWLIPKGASGIVKVDLLTDTLVCFDQWPVSVRFGKGFTPFSGGAWRKDQLVLCPWDLEHVIILDTRTGNMMESAETIPGRTYSGMAFDGCHLWLSTLEGDHILKWDVARGVGKKISGTGSPCAGICCFDGSVWLLPYYSDPLLRLDPVTEECSEAGYPKELEWKRDVRSEQSYMSRITSDTELMVTSPYANVLLRVPPHSPDQMSGVSLRISDERYVTYVSSTNECMLPDKRRGYEIDSYYPLRAFLDRVTQSSAPKEECSNTKEQRSEIGSAVWSHVKDTLRL